MALKMDYRERLCVAILLLAARICAKYGDKETQEKIDELFKALRGYGE